MKASEYGGSDTAGNEGGFPERETRSPYETMRRLAKTDPADIESGNEIIGDVAAG